MIGENASPDICPHDRVQCEGMMRRMLFDLSLRHEDVMNKILLKFVHRHFARNEDINNI